jgi:hypothetical protein
LPQVISLYDIKIKHRFATNKSLVVCFALVASFSASALGSSPAQALQVINIVYTWTGSEAIQGQERLFRDGNPSVAGTPKPFPGTSVNDPTYFYLVPFDEQPGSIVTIAQLDVGDFDSFSTLYSADLPFDPLNLAQGYLGDAGSSGLATYSIDANSSGKLFLLAIQSLEQVQ